MTYAEVVEGIRATIASYTQALDDGRTDDVGRYANHDVDDTTYGLLRPLPPTLDQPRQPPGDEPAHNARTPRDCQTFLHACQLRTKAAPIP